MKKIFYISLIFLCISCKKQKNESSNKKSSNVETINIDERRFPKVEKITNKGETDFVATLENNFSENKNIIYSPTFLFCWNEIKDKLTNVKLIEEKGINDFMILNNSNSFLNSMQKNEYKTEFSIDGENIIAKSFFNMQLTFEPNLQKLDFPIYFKNQRVYAVGMSEFDEQLIKLIEIIYYKDDENFIFKIKPKEKNNEMIFVKGLGTEKMISFQNVISKYEEFKNIGNTERNKNKLKWKYNFKEGETFEIPNIRFNFSKDYTSIIGKSFTSKESDFTILVANQKTAFILDEKGAKIESEAEIEAVAVEAEEEEEIKEAFKYLILNKTFYLIAKHNDQKNPYFVGKFENTKLMTKFD